MKNCKIGTILFLVLIIIGCSNPRPEQPNVVLILADDLGWQDVKCYDMDDPCLYETPHIDRLAEEGVKFWQAYSPTPVCSPSRGAILAGKHPARLQRTHVVGGAPPMPYHEESWSTISPWYSGRLPVKETTIAEVLKEQGYYTGHSGKWHIAIDHHAFPQCVHVNARLVKRLSEGKRIGCRVAGKLDKKITPLRVGPHVHRRTLG